MISQSHASGHHLPRLAPFNFHSARTEPRTHTSKSFGFDSPVRKPQFSPSSVEVVRKLSNSHQVAEPDLDAHVTDSKDTHAMTSPEEHADAASGTHRPLICALDRKKDKKAQARRFLVEGLNNGQYSNNGRRLYRSHTFNIAQGISLNQATNQRAGNNKKTKETNSPTDGRVPLKYISGIKHLQKEDPSKVKKAIDNWNELVLELNTEHYRRLSLESESSSEEDVPSPLHKHKHNKPIYTSHSILPSNNILKSSMKGNIPKNNPFSTGLNFSRYRPITPNLLLELDKNKLSSRKKTQRWINQLDVQSRTYSHNHQPKQSGTREVEPLVEQLEDNRLAQDVTKDPPGDRTLYRTESYGSTRTRQSSILHHSRKQPSDFL